MLFGMLILRTTTVAQVCGTPGADGSVISKQSINTYYAPLANVVLDAGSKSVFLNPVSADDAYGNSYGTSPILPGDLILIIQMQDATIVTENSRLYGSGNALAGPEGDGCTGYTSLGNSGVYEYVVAKSVVPLTGGVLDFEGAGISHTLVNRYINYPGNGADSGIKTFQVIRVPQYASLRLLRDIGCPPFNGSTGGVLAMRINTDLDFNNHTIDVSARGFRGGFLKPQPSNCNNSGYFAVTSEIEASTKGEGIAGTPRYVWDGSNGVDYGAGWQGMAGPFYGKGAPANAGGGGCDHNAGGGGGGNGGYGGKGGTGLEEWCGGNSHMLNGGRPGSLISFTNPSRLFMGGGGGAGDANDALSIPTGGIGGGIVLIEAQTVSGKGTIISNGSNGERGIFNYAPDGAGGGGAGGTIYIHVAQNSIADLRLEANGGSGGNSINDYDPAGSFEHGPGGGGGGGIIYTHFAGVVTNISVAGGKSGLSNGGTEVYSTPHGSTDGSDGVYKTFTDVDIPPYLLPATCMASLSVKKSESSASMGIPVNSGGTATYHFSVINATGGAGAEGVVVHDSLPPGFTYAAATVSYFGTATGPAAVTNSGNQSNLILGTFRLMPGDSVHIDVSVTIADTVPAGTYHNGAQVLHLDPTRSVDNLSGRITSARYALPGQNTVYESGTLSGQPVPGTNYNGSPAGPHDEDVTVISLGFIAANIICAGETLHLRASPPSEFLAPYTFSWSGPDGFTSSNQSPDIANAGAGNKGMYSVTIADKNGLVTTLQKDIPGINDNPVLTLNENTFLCTGASEILDAGTGFTSYIWQDGSTASTYTATGIGKYYVTVSDANGCKATDTSSINTIVPLPSGFLKTDTTACMYSGVQLSSNYPYSSYAWSTGSTAPSILVTEPGTYSLQVTDAHGCSNEAYIAVKFKLCPTSIYFPSAFTPNGDGLNDRFRPILTGVLQGFKLDIYTRNGERIAEITDWQKGWNGNRATIPQGADTYVWKAVFQFAGYDPEMRSGTVVLVR